MSRDNDGYLLNRTSLSLRITNWLRKLALPTELERALLFHILYFLDEPLHAVLPDTDKACVGAVEVGD
jgi:hypothetical protein